MNPLLLGFLASLIAGSATVIGAIPILFTRKISIRTQDIMLGFGAGVMLAASAFSLIVPAIESAGGGVTAGLIVAGGIAFGGLFLIFADKFFPHEHFFRGKEGRDAINLKRIWLFIIAITIHNFPEGLAVGVGFGGGTEESINNGITLAIGIGIQNIPEGLVVALALLTEKYSLKEVFFITLLTGLVEPIGGIIGVSIVSISKVLLPWGLSFAAGAMIWVVSHEIIPESHRKGYEMEATIGVVIGFIIMMFLDNTLG